MPNYIKSQTAGATYFFTLTLAQRNTSLLTDHIDWFRQAYQRANALRPFITMQFVSCPTTFMQYGKCPQMTVITHCAGVS